MEQIYEIVEGTGGGADVILLCDHASNALPPDYGSLGLGAEQLSRHIAYDIGAAGVTRAMAAALGAPAILSRYSRLLIDPNRGEDDPTLIMQLSDGAVIPGNAAIAPEEAERRIARFHRPYHAAAAGLIEAALAEGRAPVLISIHSFTPVWRGAARPWHAGVLWDKDPRFARPLIAALKAEPGLIAGDNEPYSGAFKNDALYRHGTQRGLAHALIEVRQDLIAAEEGRREWGGRLARLTRQILADPAIATECAVVRHYGSWTDGPKTPR